MTSPFPSNYIPTNQKDPDVPTNSAKSRYLQLKKLEDGESVTFRLCGSAATGHVISGYMYFTGESKPRRFPVFPKDYEQDIGLNFDKTAKGFPYPFLAWACAVKDAPDYMILDITQEKVRERIEAILNIPDYVILDEGMANFYLIATRNGIKKDTRYNIDPVLKAPTHEEAKAWQAAEGGIWLPALYEGGDPFEGRPNAASIPVTEPSVPRDSLGADQDTPPLAKGKTKTESVPASW